MNHSCCPNTYAPPTGRTSNTIEYETITTRPIAKGEELTCDYNVFDYECDGHAIDPCGCNAKECRGAVKGFKTLDLRSQIALLHQVEPEIFECFVNIATPTFVELTEPPAETTADTTFSSSAPVIGRYNGRYYLISEARSS